MATNSHSDAPSSRFPYLDSPYGAGCWRDIVGSEERTLWPGDPYDFPESERYIWFRFFMTAWSHLFHEPEKVVDYKMQYVAEFGQQLHQAKFRLQCFLTGFQLLLSTEDPDHLSFKKEIMVFRLIHCPTDTVLHVGIYNTCQDLDSDPGTYQWWFFRSDDHLKTILREDEGLGDQPLRWEPSSAKLPDLLPLQPDGANPEDLETMMKELEALPWPDAFTDLATRIQAQLNP